MSDRSLRDQLRNFIVSNEAHLDWAKALRGFPAKLRGVRPQGAPHSAWELLEHVRIAQWDILEFSRNPAHVSPDFPSGYWPKTAAPPNAAAWEKSVRAFFRDRKEMQALVTKSTTDLFAAIPHGSGQTILREALLVADHNAHHLGQFILLRQILGCWPRS